MGHQPPGAMSFGDQRTPAGWYDDARAVSLRLRYDRIAHGIERAARHGAPSLAYDDFPRELGKPEVRVDEAAARLAGAIFG